jgi:hypothetical protein
MPEAAVEVLIPIHQDQPVYTDQAVTAVVVMAETHSRRELQEQQTKAAVAALAEEPSQELVVEVVMVDPVL